MTEIQAVPLTANKVVVLRGLELGPKKWSVLRKEYFGEGRAKMPASTSFFTQIQGMIAKGLVIKSDVGYAITPVGAASIAAVRNSGFDVDGCKTAAHLKFESEHPVAATIATETVATEIAAETPVEIAA